MGFRVGGWRIRRVPFVSALKPMEVDFVRIIDFMLVRTVMLHAAYHMCFYFGVQLFLVLFVLLASNIVVVIDMCSRCAQD